MHDIRFKRVAIRRNLSGLLNISSSFSELLEEVAALKGSIQKTFLNLLSPAYVGGCKRKF